MILAMAASIALGQETAPARPPRIPEWQIAAGGAKAFEVASIKPSKTFRPPNFPLDPGDAYAAVGGRFSADFPLINYITFAYKLALTGDQRESLAAALPRWASSDLFEIEARAEGNPTKDQMRLMMQTLLADRFKLAVHFESREETVLALVLVKPGKLGPKLRPHEQGPPCDPSAGATNGPDVFPPRCQVYARARTAKGTNRDGSRDTTMTIFAGSLRELGRPVVDRTGLSGRFDFEMEWAPDPSGPPPPDAAAAPDIPGPTLLEALRDQLGLRVESTKAPIETLVVDHVERPSEN
jgi:uncharacterized protein (TIGR03435 family)